MSTEADQDFAAALRERAMKLYRRADHMPLHHDDGSIDEHVALKAKADRYMAEAERLDSVNPSA